MQVGAEMFFSGRGHFAGPPGLTVSTDERLSQDGWQNCASCHFKGLTDGVVWFVRPRAAQVHPDERLLQSQATAISSGS